MVSLTILMNAFCQAACEVTFHPFTHQWKGSLLEILIIVEGFQLISYLYPNDGWGYWNFVDPPLQFIKVGFSAFRLTPLLRYLKIDFVTYMFVTLSMIFNWTILIIQMIIAHRLLKQQEIKHRDLQQQPALLKIMGVYHDFFQVLYIPQMRLLIGTLVCGSNSLLVELRDNYCAFLPMQVLSIIGLVPMSIHSMINIYFFRATQFWPFNILQKRYSFLSPLNQSLTLVLIIVESLEANDLINYVRLLFIWIIPIIQIIENMMILPYQPPFIAQRLRMNVIQVGLNFIVSVNILSNNTIINEDQLFFATLFIFTYGFALAQQISNRRDKGLSRLIGKYRELTSAKVLYLCQLVVYYDSLSLQDPSKRVQLVQMLWTHNTNCEDPLCRSRYSDQKDSQHVLAKFTILCLLQNSLTKSRLTKDEDSELIQLVYINYLANNCKKPLLSYIELQSYSLTTQLQSKFFECAQGKMAKQIQLLIYKRQQIIGKTNFWLDQLQSDRNLEIKDIVRNLELEEMYIPRLLSMIDAKIEFWERMVKGYQRMEDLLDEVVQLSVKMVKVHSQLVKDLGNNYDSLDEIKQAGSVYKLKLASLCHSLVINDFNACYLCEYQIEFLLSSERSLPTERRVNLQLIDDQVILIMISVSNNKGMILNKDRAQVATFFGYESDKDFTQITHFIAIEHDHLITNFIKSGKSNLFKYGNLTFGFSKQGFIFPVSLKLDNYFQIAKDYAMAGSVSKTKGNNEFLLFDKNGSILGMTHNLFAQFRESDNAINIHQICDRLSIFLLIPNIFNILQKYKEQENEENEQMFVEDKTYIALRQNFSQYAQQFKTSRAYQYFLEKVTNRSQGISSQRSWKVARSMTNRQVSKAKAKQFKMMDSEPTIPEQNEKFKETIFQDNQFQSLVEGFQQECNDNISPLLIHCSVQFKVMGHGTLNKGFFVLEISEYKLTEALNGKSFNNSTFDNLILPNTMRDTISEKLSFWQNVLSIKEPKHHELIHNKPNEISKQRILDDLSAVQMGIMSPRESMSYGPLSQRAQMLNPNQKHLDEDLEYLENDFKELRLSQRQGKPEIPEEDEYDGVKSNGVPKSSGSQKVDSNRIQKAIMMNNKAVDNEEDFGAKYSQASTAKTSTNTSSTVLVKQMQKIRSLSPNLYRLSILNFILISVIIAYIAVNCIVNQNIHDEILASMNDIKTPVTYNQIICQSLTLSMILVLNNLQILNNSEYLRMEIKNVSASLGRNLVDNFSEMFPVFIGLERRELISKQVLFLPGIDHMINNTDFTKFHTMIQQRAIESLIVDVDKDSIELKDTTIIPLMVLRGNFRNVYEMNSKLITTLNMQFTEALNSQGDNILDIFIAEIVVGFVTIFVQLWFWRKLYRYTQQILILLTRVQEQDVELIRQRLMCFKDVLQKRTRQKWLKANYFQLAMQSKFQKINLDFQQNLRGKHLQPSLKVRRVNKTNQHSSKQGSNVSLTARISNNQLTLTYVIGSLFLINASLTLFLYGGLNIKQTQNIGLAPSQALTLSYVTFNQQVDSICAAALLVKTQYLFENQLLKLDLVSNETLTLLNQADRTAELFAVIFKTFSQAMASIIKQILLSKQISGEDKEILFSLYKTDFCLLLNESLKFCRYTNQSAKSFAAKYGQFDPNDNNQYFLGNGIIGIVSRLAHIFKENYDREISTNQTDNNRSNTILLNSHDFVNGILEHYIDNIQGFRLFFDTILSSTKNIMGKNLEIVITYYLSLGIALILILSVILYKWIKLFNERLILLRVSLSILPLEVLSEQSFISLLKKLGKD